MFGEIDMKRTLQILGCSLALSASGPALADVCPSGGNPAQNVTACTAAGGVFTQVGALRNCVVTEKAEHVTCARPVGNPFEADISASTTTYTRQGDVCTTTKTGGLILACINPNAHGGEGGLVNPDACADKGCLD